MCIISSRLTQSVAFNAAALRRLTIQGYAHHISFIWAVVTKYGLCSHHQRCAATVLLVYFWQFYPFDRIVTIWFDFEWDILFHTMQSIKRTFTK